MGVELDWLEREERYRRRVIRMLVVAAVLVGGAILVTSWMRTRAHRLRRAAEAQQMIAKRDAEAEARRAQFVADSSATANRLAEFIRVHGATPMAEVPILMVPLPPGVGATALAQRVWTEYARVADPAVSAATESDWYRLYYVDLMNAGPLRGRAVLLPAMRQSGTALTIIKPSFSDITRAQVEVGMRDVPVEAGLDSAALMMQPPVDAGTTPPPATTTETTPPPAPPPVQTPPAAPPVATTPPASPAADEPVDLEPVVEPVIEPDVVAPSPVAPKSTAPDSVPPPKP